MADRIQIGCGVSSRGRARALKPCSYRRSPSFIGHSLRLCALLAATYLVPVCASLADPPKSLEADFKDPPASARPRVWWHWMNGNITEDGIAKDLEWMKRAGIGGVQNFDINLYTPQIVKKRLVYMTPEWKQAFRYATTLADTLGLELAIASSPGFSETGGPWVLPQDGMKKLVWSETRIAGGRRHAGALPLPPRTTGPYQAIAMAPDITDLTSGGKRSIPKTFYADVAVLAYPARDIAVPQPQVMSPAGEPIDGAALFDGEPGTALAIRGSIVFDYGRSQTIRSASIFLPGAKPPIGEISIGLRLDSSDDGVTWRPVASLDVAGVPTTVSFAPVVARRFRVVVTGRKPDAGNTLQRSAKIGTLLLSPDARVDHAETKAGFATALDYFALPTPADETGVAPDRVIDITQRMRPDGTLDWVPPKGQWRILRLGTSLLGTRNHPATLEATGLEVDKYDGPAVRRYLDTYLGAYRDTVGAAMIGEHGIRALLTDSSEVGAANWTPRMVEHFKALRGYDPTPWLPALTGVLVGTRAQSDAFLFDFRRTLADLLASEHYGTIAAVAHENGLKLYGEALEDHGPMLGDDMAMRSHTDVPMAAMWTPDVNRPIATYVADIKGAASVAHLYGQNLVAAESLTSANKPWAFGPSDLRPVIDLEFATGVNRPVIHTSVHQPLDDKIPGLSLFYFGRFFNRHESWAEMARPWMDYMARNSVMLQRGRNVADVAYFYGEEAPLTGLYGDTAVADAPTRYAYDFANADVVTTVLSVDHGDLVAKSGARYKLLYLGGSSRRMTLPMLRRIADLVREGATVVGPAPIGSPGLGGDTPEYEALIKILWPGAPVATVGQGRVIANGDVEAALGMIGVTPDFSHSSPHPETQILFVHRRLDDGDVYFVNNRQNLDEQVEARFRVTGKVPEIWHADTGKSEPVSYRIEGAETVVPLNFGPQDSFFVVFRKPATAAMLEVAQPTFTPVAALNGAWRVAFQANRGAPASITLPTLGSLSEQADPGVKYFSGIATYTKSFNLTRNTPPGTPMMLDLGKVGVIAEVRVNGNLIGTVWHAPYRLDIGPALKRGHNMLDIRVADLWVNRLIGDAQPGAKKITFTTIPTYNAKSPLVPAGLIGPVRLFVPATAR